MSQRETYLLSDSTWRRGRNALAAVALAGWAASAAAWSADPHAFFTAYLTAFVFCASILAGALFFVMLQHLTGSAWSVTVRRLAEYVMSTIPVAALLFIPVTLGLSSIYEWTHEGASLGDKVRYLNPPFFLLRTVIYFALWSLWAWKLRRFSVRQDREGTIALTRAEVRWSAPGLVMLMVTSTLAAFDWVMSLSPHWSSTIFGIYLLSGGVLAFFALLVLIALSLRAAGVMRDSINRAHYHDLGKWLFALTVFWAYIAFSQYMLMWYANLPEEIVWYRQRLTGGWGWVSAALLIGRFLIPFNLLLPRASKRNLGVLGAAAAWIVLMHYLDVFWLIRPAFGWPHFATAAAVGGTLALAFWARLKNQAIAPVGDPRFEQALVFENS